MECDLECDLVDNHTRHKHLVYILTISFFFLSGFIVSNFFYDKRSSNALLIEEILLKKDKTPIQSWLHLLGQRKGRAINNVDYIEDQSTEDLANYIDLKMNDLDQQTLQKIQKNIAVADELISRVPNSYSAYKAKLISLLILEAKYDQNIDDYEVQGLLERMAEFDVSRDALSMREAILLSNNNTEVIQIEEKLWDINLKIEQNELEHQALDVNSSYARLLEVQQAQLIDEEQSLFEKMVILERNLNEADALFDINPNEDLVHILFLRLLARNELDAVISSAQSFIQEFPESPIGFLYLVKALNLLGREDESFMVIVNSTLSRESLSQIQATLENLEGENTKDYWKMLKF